MKKEVATTVLAVIGILAAGGAVLAQDEQDDLSKALDSTATQFPTVDRVVYSFGGDIAAFYEWLQRTPPEPGV